MAKAIGRMNGAIFIRMACRLALLKFRREKQKMQLFFGAARIALIDKLVNLARSWEKDPELILKGDGYHYDGY